MPNLRQIATKRYIIQKVHLWQCDDIPIVYSESNRPGWKLPPRKISVLKCSINEWCLDAWSMIRHRGLLPIIQEYHNALRESCSCWGYEPTKSTTVVGKLQGTWGKLLQNPENVMKMSHTTWAWGHGALVPWCHGALLFWGGDKDMAPGAPNSGSVTASQVSSACKGDLSRVVTPWDDYPLRICAKLSDLRPGKTPSYFFAGGSDGSELGSEPAKPKEPQRMAHRSGRITGMIQVEIYGKRGFTMSYHPNMSVDFPWFSLEPSLQYNRMVLGKKQNIPQISSEVLWLRRALWHFDVAIGGSTAGPQEIHGCWRRWSVHLPRVALILTRTYLEQTKQCNLRQLLNWDSLLLAVWMLGRLLGRFELQRVQSGRIQSYQLIQKHGQQSWSEN